MSAASRLRAEQPAAWAKVRAVGLSGQMHGAVLLDGSGEVLRPAILWNDVRSAAECGEMMATLPSLPAIAGNLAMPGFTAPKLAWVRKHEPAIFARVAKVLLPKDYLRYRLCGTFVGEMSDAAGTLWLDVAARRWSDELLALTGLTRSHMPELVEGSAVSGTVRDDIAAAWGLPRGVVVRRRRGRQRGECRRHRRGAAGRRASSRSARAAWCSSSTTASARTRPRPCTPSATRCPAAGTRCR